MRNFLKFYKNKKIFITGHTGFKGIWLTNTLLHLGASVTGFSLKDNKISNYKKNCNYKKVKNIFGNILDKNLLKKKLNNINHRLYFI